MIRIEDLRKSCLNDMLIVTKHIRARCLERDITISDVQNVIMNGEIIKKYEDDSPYPSCLLLGLSINGKLLHAVASYNDGWTHLITAYYPDPDKWESDFKTRRNDQ